MDRTLNGWPLPDPSRSVLSLCSSQLSLLSCVKPSRLVNSPMIEEDVRNLDFGVKSPDFYRLAVNSESYKTNSVGAKENMPVCAQLGPGTPACSLWPGKS